MVQSMTGYGSGSIDSEFGKIQIDLKSLNSKNLDLCLTFGSSFKPYENDFRNQISKELKRGKIDLKIFENTSHDNVSYKLNHKAIKHHIKDLNKISSISDDELLKIAINLPDSVKLLEVKHNEKFKKKIFLCLSKVIKTLTRFRINEGKALKVDLVTNLNIINSNLSKIEQIAPRRIDKIKDRLNESIKKLNLEFDKGRFEQEIVFYIEKLDINEEIVRLKNHIVFFNKTLLNKDVVKGKKLNFISQEMGREINTIGSKANHFETQLRVVEMKTSLEKIKEQLLNVL